MCESRARGSCTKMNLNGKIVIVTAGGISDSVELLDPLANDGWIPGKTKKKICNSIILRENKIIPPSK